MIIYWSNNISQKQDWYGHGFVSDFFMMGSGIPPVASGTFINRLLLLGVG